MNGKVPLKYFSDEPVEEPLEKRLKIFWKNLWMIFFKKIRILFYFFLSFRTFSENLVRLLEVVYKRALKKTVKDVIKNKNNREIRGGWMLRRTLRVVFEETGLNLQIKGPETTIL